MTLFSDCPVNGSFPGQIFDMWTLLEICTEFKIKSTSNDQKIDHLERKRLPRADLMPPRIWRSVNQLEEME